MEIEEKEKKEKETNSQSQWLAAAKTWLGLATRKATARSQ